MSKKLFIRTSWDDGNPLDKKLVKLLMKYKIEATFYVPLQNKKNQVLEESEIKEISRNFEIGGHTYNHSILTELSDEEIEFELSKSKESLEKITGKEIISFCYPKGQYNKKIMKKVEQTGYKGGRTAEIFRINFDNPYELNTTVQAVDRILASKGKGFLKTSNLGLAKKLLSGGNLFKNWNLIAKKTLDYVLENGGVWHLWGHSWEIERNNDWEKLEDLLQLVHEKGRTNNASFVTNGEIFTKISVN